MWGGRPPHPLPPGSPQTSSLSSPPGTSVSRSSRSAAELLAQPAVLLATCRRLGDVARRASPLQVQVQGQQVPWSVTEVSLARRVLTSKGTGWSPLSSA